MTQIQPESWSIPQRDAAVVGSISSVVKLSQSDSRALFSSRRMLKCTDFRGNWTSCGHRARVLRHCPEAIQYSLKTRSCFCLLQSLTSVSAPAPISAGIALVLCALPEWAYFLLTKNSERILQCGFVVKQDSAAFFCACISVPTSDSVREAETSKASSFFRWEVDESTLRGQMGASLLHVPGESTWKSGSPRETFHVCTSRDSHQNEPIVFLWESLLSQPFFSPVVGQLIPCTDC